MKMNKIQKVIEDSVEGLLKFKAVLGNNSISPRTSLSDIEGYVLSSQHNLLKAIEDELEGRNVKDLQDFLKSLRELNK